jgi:hypothetical protein
MENAQDTGLEQDAVLIGAEDISDFNGDNILPQSPEDITKIHEWLQLTAYCDSDSEYMKNSSSYLAGTGMWLLSSEAYKEWHSSQETGVLWIRGTFPDFIVIGLPSVTIAFTRSWIRQISHGRHSSDFVKRRESPSSVLLLPPNHRR